MDGGGQAPRELWGGLGVPAEAISSRLSSNESEREKVKKESDMATSSSATIS